MQIDVRVAIHIGGPENVPAIGRKVAAVGLPLIVGEPGDFLRSKIEQADVGVAVLGIRSNEESFAIGRKIVCRIELFAGVRRE